MDAESSAMTTIPHHTVIDVNNINDDTEPTVYQTKKTIESLVDANIQKGNPKYNVTVRLFTETGKELNDAPIVVCAFLYSFCHIRLQKLFQSISWPRTPVSINWKSYIMNY